MGYTEDDYLSVASKFSPETFIYYMRLAYGVGYDTGTKIIAKHLAKKIVAFNGLEQLSFESVREAARQMRVGHPSILKSIRIGCRCRGYYWRYAG